ncbi:RHS repeat-associated core domain-containing protein [Bradyrhizobium sp. USDA 336]|uniref:RHS repeat-associated core domain-containing protein n=1 Tax=Bradyrhizobium sp. USDA 336 TaxID=3156311 RepID=UPI0038327720
MARVTVRDGVREDDAPSAVGANGVTDNSRHTCFSYDGGRYDRFERQFVGYARVDMVEGCELGARTPIETAGPSWGTATKGLRRTERHYANGSIYEAGLLVQELVFDITDGAQATAPQRALRQNYVLIDTAVSNDMRMVCHHLRHEQPLDLDRELFGLGFVRNVYLSSSDGAGDSVQIGCRKTFASDEVSLVDPVFDSRPRRLTPALVQIIRETSEARSSAAASRLRTAIQFNHDRFARPTRVCDLGEVLKSGAAQTRGAICSDMIYDDSVRPQFTHGATGGGTILLEQRNRVKEIRVSDSAGKETSENVTAAFDTAPDEVGNKSRLLRRRTATHDPQTGMVLTLCHFVDLTSTNPCASDGRFPDQAFRLEQAARMGIVMRAYRYDQFGNLERFLGPVGSGRTYVAKAYSFDPLISLVETAERTEHCAPSAVHNGTTICVSGSTHTLGSLRSFASAVDYRHGVATVAIDVNRNATYVPLDELGRPVRALVSWPTTGQACTDCSGLNTSHTTGLIFTKIARYTYEEKNATLKAPSATVQRFVDDQAYGDLPNKSLLSKSFVDQLGEQVQTIEEALVCRRSLAGFSDARCDETHNYVASGLIAKDRLNRAVSDDYPASLKIAPDSGAGATDVKTEQNLAKQPIVVAAGARNKVTFDGLDRPIKVELRDGNHYDFQYRIETSLNTEIPLLRHRTDMRNAFCVPSAIERDVRGAIRSVIESYETTTIRGITTAAEGANPQGKLPADRKLVKTVAAATPTQQTYTCNPDRGQKFELADSRSVASYDQDTLGQLVQVNLPRRTAGEKVDAIRVGYDPLGRRVLVDDPDRGFERIVMDGIGNAVCTYSGVRRNGLLRTDFPKPDFENIGENVCADPKPKEVSDAGLSRLVRTDYLANLPRRTTFKLFGNVERDEVQLAAEREITIEYGKAPGSEPASHDDRVKNRVGRPFRMTDMVGVETKEFDALGRPIKTERVFSKLDAFKAVAVKPTLTITDAYDIWGPHKSRTLKIDVPAKAAKGRPEPAAARIREEIAYRYSPAGQLRQVLARSLPPEVPAPQQAPPPPPFVAIASDLIYDERGNLLSMNYATGVEVLQTFDQASNRLLTSMARMGSPLGEVPPIYFQNLNYRYDPAGNVLAYANRPLVADQCTLPMPEIGCDETIAPEVAKRHGLLIDSSVNSFAYDQLNRIRLAKKSLTSVHVKRTDKEGEPNLLDETEIAKATKLSLDFEETIVFRPTHEMALLRQAETRTVEVIKGATKTALESRTVDKKTATVTSTYTSDGDPRHAPGKVRTVHDERKLTVLTSFDFDDFGRMNASLCKQSDKKGCRPDRYFHWNVDDTLRVQNVQIPSERLPSAKKGNGLIYYDRIVSDYDSTAQRAFKAVTEQGIRKVNGKSKIEAERFVSDMMYADAQLTIARREGQTPQAVIHYFGGPQRLASKWVGDERMFTYHAQLQTRNVTDIVVGKPGAPETARLNGQQEYAAFGEMLHERETLLAGNKDGVNSRANPGLPQYRFNAKEQDESGLQNFGARFYDNNLAIWLRPDPVLHDYLDGKINGGVYTKKNLASYSFAWGNPTGYIDRDGRAPSTPIEPPSPGWQALEIAAGGVTIVQKSIWGAAKCVCGTAAIFVPILGPPVTYGLYASGGADFTNAYYEGRGIVSRLRGDHAAADKAFQTSTYIDTMNDIVGGPVYLGMKAAGQSDEDAFRAAFYSATATDIFSFRLKSAKDVLKVGKEFEEGSRVMKTMDRMEQVDKAQKVKAGFDQLRKDTNKERKD